jgi:CDP-glucose 4,6-dehydratase
MENLAMMGDFWAGKRVFITGHTGFKGGWLSIWLKMMGAEICGYSLAPSSTPNLFNEAKIGASIQSVIGDVRDRHLLQQTIDQFQPEVIFHLAAQSLVRESYTDPVTTYETNVLGTVNILEAARSIKGVQSIIIVTSDKCYENKEWLWGYREGESLGGDDPYSSSKACAELVSSAYRKSFFDGSQQTAGIATVRAGNVIGGGDWATDRLIPDLIQSFINNKPAYVRNPKAVRPWQHVLEPLFAYLLLAEKLYSDKAFADSWNFGPDISETKPVEWIANTLSEIWGQKACWRADEGTHPHEAHLLKLDSTKAKSVLHWHPKTNLKTALTMTAEWFKAYMRGEDILDFTKVQIRQFLTMQ